MLGAEFYGAARAAGSVEGESSDMTASWRCFEGKVPTPTQHVPCRVPCPLCPLYLRDWRCVFTQRLPLRWADSTASLSPVRNASFKKRLSVLLPERSGALPLRLRRPACHGHTGSLLTERSVAERVDDQRLHGGRAAAASISSRCQRYGLVAAAITAGIGSVKPSAFLKAFRL